MSVAVYMRVSTNDQKADSQEPDIKRWLEAHGHNPEKIQWYVDRETGKHLSRSGFNALSEDIFSGQIKTVVVWKLDRIARSMRDGINTLCAWCDSGVRVVSVTQQLDLSGTVGRIVAGVLFGVAEIELQNNKDRQNAGIAIAKERGIYKGRKKGTTKAKPDRAKELKAKGFNEQEIANALNVSERTVFRYLAA